MRTSRSQPFAGGQPTGTGSFVVAAQRTRNSSLRTTTGAPVMASSIIWMLARTCGAAVRRFVRAALIPADRARSNRRIRSASSSRRAAATDASALVDTPRSVPRSSRVQWSPPTWARTATSSRRSPLTRRLAPWTVRSACCAVILARRELRKSRTSSRLSMFSTVRAGRRGRQALSLPVTAGTPSHRRVCVASSWTTGVQPHCLGSRRNRQDTQCPHG